MRDEFRSVGRKLKPAVGILTRGAEQNGLRGASEAFETFRRALGKMATPVGDLAVGDRIAES
jgi:hypothetical protein